MYVTSVRLQLRPLPSGPLPSDHSPADGTGVRVLDSKTFSLVVIVCVSVRPRDPDDRFCEGFLESSVRVGDDHFSSEVGERAGQSSPTLARLGVGRPTSLGSGPGSTRSSLGSPVVVTAGVT